MKGLIQEYLTQKQTLKYWILTDLMSIALPVVGIFAGASENLAVAVVLFIAGFAAIVVAIVGMNSTQKRMNQVGLAITKQLLQECGNDAGQTSQKLKEQGISTTYLRISLRDSASRKAEQPAVGQKTAQEKSDALLCPNCQSEHVHWIPFEKAKLGILFWIYFVGSALGMVFSPFITAVVFVCWIMVMISRISSARKARVVNRMQCDLCGTVFEVPKSFTQGDGARDR